MTSWRFGVPCNPARVAILFERQKWLYLAVLAALMLAALALRVYNLDAPGILPEREFHSMTIARVSYFERAEGVPAWRREIALLQRQKLWNLEPPLMELAVARIYQLAGEEVVAAARILNAVLWICGGVFMYALAVRLMPPVAALVATAYYLFVPLGVLVSRSFQPDTLMLVLWVASLFALIVYAEQQTWPTLVAAACVSSLTLLVKPLPAFTTLAAFLALQGADWKRLFEPKTWCFLLIAFAPAGLYYGYGVFGSGDLSRYVQMGFRPHLLQHREFWEGLLRTATAAVAPGTLVAGLASVAIVPPGHARRVLTSLCFGYAIFCLVFTHHVHTHTYYHLQLMIITALALGLLAAAILPALEPQLANWGRLGLPLGLAVLIAMFFAISDVRTGLRHPRFERPQVAARIGEFVRHSRRVVHVSRHYGQPLEFFGEFSGAEWPKSEEYWLYRRPGERPLGIGERLSGLGFTPEYFVVTDFEGFRTRHADLKRFLESRCQPLVADDEYLIYDGACASEGRVAAAPDAAAASQKAGAVRTP